MYSAVYSVWAVSFAFEMSAKLGDAWDDPHTVIQTMGHERLDLDSNNMVF